MPRPKRQRKKVTPEAISVSSLLSLPPELRLPIISKLSLSDALNLRLTCQTLNREVLSFYPHFQFHITGDRLNIDQLIFLNRIQLKRITFKRVSEPIKDENNNREESDDDDFLPFSRKSPCWVCTRKKIYTGPCSYFEVGGIQIRSLSAPAKIPTRIHNGEDINNGCGRGMGKESIIYDYAILRNYLRSVGSDDIFKHII